MKRLFKYVVPDRVDTLTNASLRFTQPHLFNDPFEMQPVLNSLLSEEEEKRIGLEVDSSYIRSIADEILPNLYEKLGILCLTEKSDNLLMWAHYADHHRGFVLEFDPHHEFFNRKKGGDDLYHHPAKVGYSDTRPSVSFKDYLGVVTLLTKSVEWEYEQEWRMILHFDESTTPSGTRMGTSICSLSRPPA